ncbi:hypothetical protein FEM48_Zijuj02G0168700 [Ziziphus jujuba var. spinosa]|uniref:Patatin n=1 Tax=Ziziphus jujuba var. spinosa TaxID=714518 RepID=A0A978VWU5_ZIZJJ|nr:hypothetical protein FEM48_Zijuj02G0168700 [Ziziphus jujuba var. spinosa]
MLTTPNDTSNPTFAAKDIVDFYLKNSKFIFPDEDSVEANKNLLLDATSAATYYLPPHHFQIKSSKGTIEDYNLVDGGVAANNPNLFAICALMREWSQSKNPSFLKSTEHSKFLILAVGTGSSNLSNKLEVGDPNEWGLVKWFIGPEETTPLMDVFSTAMNDMVDIYISVFYGTMVDIYISVLYGTSGSKENHLRIQTDSLDLTEASTDKSSKNNLDKLEKIDNELLKKPVSQINFDNGLYEPIEGHGTNEEALVKFSERLSGERKKRVA